MAKKPVTPVAVPPVTPADPRLGQVHLLGTRITQKLQQLGSIDMQKQDLEAQAGTLRGQLTQENKELNGLLAALAKEQGVDEKTHVFDLGTMTFQPRPTA